MEALKKRVQDFSKKYPTDQEEPGVILAEDLLAHLENQMEERRRTSEEMQEKLGNLEATLLEEQEARKREAMEWGKMEEDLSKSLKVASDLRIEAEEKLKKAEAENQNLKKTLGDLEKELEQRRLASEKPELVSPPPKPSSSSKFSVRNLIKNIERAKSKSDKSVKNLVENFESKMK